MAVSQIGYTRHARRRMRLYGITPDQVELVLLQPDQGPATEGQRLAVTRRIRGAFRELPLKVIYVMEGERTIVLSAYPLKRAYRR